ncbi:unnamed protein product [Nippostrongylus brasiliensis]|uniref:t-SNARE coiled-coil homology domain-containing protein n=1 Tax=Nippostrongylus brasiliensis TaxID=27835 RepID=A0A0N4YHG2_NIPBR|nr:unnamed protein product [Nippostrongylus brasiliensis]
MPIRDRLASLKRTLIEDGEVQVMSSLIRAEEEEKTNEFLRRASSLREAIGEMNKALELIRQLHNLLKVSTDNPDRTRLRYLFDELTRVFQQFSSDLDQVVAAVNDGKPPIRIALGDSSIPRRRGAVRTGNTTDDGETAQKTLPPPPATTHSVEGKRLQGGDEKLDESVLTEVKQRNDELLLLEEAVSTLNSLHEHLNFLVHAEDPILNRIETNIQQAAEYTVKVMNDTEEAVKLDESAKKKSVIVFCTIGLLLFILILMIITSARVWIIGR